MSDELDPNMRAIAARRIDALLAEATEYENMARAKYAAADILIRTWKLENTYERSTQD